MPAKNPELAYPKVAAPQPAAPTRQPFYNPFTGPLFEPVTMESAGRAASSLSNLLNPFASAQRMAASAGRAIGTTARGLATGETPLMGRPAGDRGVAAAVPRLPSGAMGGGYDIYPTGPQIPPATTPTQFPYGHPLGPRVYSQAPTATTLTTGVYSPVPLGQSFAGINPAQRTEYIPFAGGGMATFGLGGANVQYPSRLGLMGGNIASGAISPLPVQTQQSFTAGLTPLAQPSMGIEGGPVSLRGATAMTAPVTAAQQGRQAVQTPYGTIYATAGQQQAFASRPTAYEGRTPAQQQALLAQMREKGAQAGARYTQMMKNFAESRGPRFAPMAAPQGLFGQPLTKLFPQSTEAVAQRAERSAPVLAATGFGAMQRSMGQSPALRGPLAGTQSPFANMGVGSYASRFAGGPQPAQSTSLLTDQQRRNIFRMV